MTKNLATEKIMGYLESEIVKHNQLTGRHSSIEFKVIEHLTHNRLEYYFIHDKKHDAFNDNYGYIDIVGEFNFKGVINDCLKQYEIKNYDDLNWIFKL